MLLFLLCFALAPTDNLPSKTHSPRYKYNLARDSLFGCAVTESRHYCWLTAEPSHFVRALAVSPRQNRKVVKGLLTPFCETPNKWNFHGSPTTLSKEIPPLQCDCEEQAMRLHASKHYFQQSAVTWKDTQTNWRHPANPQLVFTFDKTPMQAYSNPGLLHHITWCLCRESPSLFVSIC